MPAVLFASVPHDGDPESIVLLALSSPTVAYQLLDRVPADETRARVVIPHAEAWRAWAGVLRLWVDAVGHQWRDADLKDSAVLQEIFTHQLRTAAALGPKRFQACVSPDVAV